MLKIYKLNNGSATETTKIEGKCWIQITTPSKDDLLFLEEKAKIPAEMCTAALDLDERARYEVEDNIVLILLRVPILNDLSSAEIPFITIPLGIIVTDDLFITISANETYLLDDFAAGRVKNFNSENQVRFVLQIFSKAAIRFLDFLKEINTKTSIIEHELRQAQKNQELIRLLNYEKSLVYFTTSLRSNQIMMERLRKTTFYRRAIEQDRELLEDIIIDNTQAIEMANIYSNILSGLMDAFASVINNNLNNVMKTLTKLTVVLMVPTLVASIYGMNVKLPMQDSPYGFLSVIGVCVVAGALTSLLFSTKKWQ